jgi:hypothetical protein
VKIPGVNDAKQRVFPVIQVTDHGELRRVKVKDVRVVEAAMAIAVSFMNLVTKNPIPPAPHPIAYKFEACQEVLTYSSGFKCKVTSLRLYF